MPEIVHDSSAAVPGRVSVLVITYNQAQFVRETIASVQQQEYPDLEIVVADDSSRDGTADSILELAAADARIVPVLADRNRGIAANWNAALRRCTGEFVAYLGGDDMMLPGKISKQVAYLRAHPECVVCVHDVEAFDSVSGRRLYLHSERHGMPEGGIELELSSSWTLGLLGKQPKSLQSAQMVRASAMPPHGFDERLPYANDWMHGLEVLRHGRRGYVREVLARYRRHPAQVSSRGELTTEGIEEFLVVLAVVAARYPDLAARVKDVRNWLLFQRVLFRWDPPALQAARERQLRVEAGWLRWMYARLLRSIVGNPALIAATRPLRRALQSITRLSGRGRAEVPVRAADRAS